MPTQRNLNLCYSLQYLLPHSQGCNFNNYYIRDIQDEHDSYQNTFYSLYECNALVEVKSWKKFPFLFVHQALPSLNSVSWMPDKRQGENVTIGAGEEGIRRLIFRCLISSEVSYFSAAVMEPPMAVSRGTNAFTRSFCRQLLLLIVN